MTNPSHIEHPFAWLEPRLRKVEVLWGRGRLEESYALLKQSLSEALAVLRLERNAPPELMRELEQLVREAPAWAVPDVASEQLPVQRVWLERTRSACLRLQGVPQRPQALRVWIAIGLCLLAGAVAAYAVRAPKLEATASAEYAPEYAASNAVDGRAETEWLLPGAELGYLDVDLGTTREVKVAVITNAHNRHYVDRGVKKARLELYDDDTLVDKVDIAFAKLESKHNPVRFKLKGKRGNRIRIEVLEFHSLGAGIAEVRVE
jgi:hypothetical protein